MSFVGSQSSSKGRVVCAFLLGVILLATGAPQSNLSATTVAPSAVAAQLAGGVGHDPPVDAPIVDPFRPPENRFGPGNRGIEYGSVPGQTVRATSGGVVSFAGQVGGDLFVTVRHDPQLRTTVGFVGEILVEAGERVERGQPIAIAAGPLHFTARRDGIYFDPELLFMRFRVVVRLTPVS